MVPVKQRSAFTLIELMVVVSILGVLAAIAVPSFMAYMHRARTTEAVQNLNTLYGAAAALYVWERADRGVTATVVTSCVAEPTPRTPAAPMRDKQPFVATGGFLQLGFKVADLIYYGYGFQSVGAPATLTCFPGGRGNNPDLYTFFANGDLDGDGTLSTFELAVGSSETNQLYHSRGLFITNEVE
jgi:prepilin-type N-terminal cleavage/methylation domain-containing protein